MFVPVALIYVSLCVCVYYRQWVCLPKLTPENYRVSILRSLNEDPGKFQPWDFFK